MNDLIHSDELKWTRQLSPAERWEFALLSMLTKPTSDSYRHNQVKNCIELGLKADHFQRASHKWAWETIVKRWERGDLWDAVNISFDIPSNQPTWFNELAAFLCEGPTARNEFYFCGKILARKLSEKSAVTLSEAATNLARFDEDSPQEVSERIQQVFDSLSTRDIVVGASIVSMPIALENTIKNFEEAEERKLKGESILIKTGLESFDKKYGGINRQGMQVLGARPGVGKTTVAINVALKASQAGHRVLFFTHEMNHVELATKFISIAGKISSTKMRKGDISPNDVPKIYDGVRSLQDLPISIDDKSMPSWDVVKRRIISHAKTYKLDLVIIDYIQQLIIEDPEKKFSSRVQELTAITSAIKRISQELNLSILCCAQLNREAQHSADRGNYPTLAQLRDCGSIEQDADLVMFIHRSEDEMNGDLKNWLLVEKHRHDEAGLMFELESDLQFSTVKTVGVPTKISRKK